jgi:pimeloyl-ACP methyl ester carboxylesterase
MNGSRQRLFTPTMKLKDWKEQGQYIDYQGHKAFYLSLASNKPWLILVHGYPTASWDWADMWSGLAEHFSLLAMDMMGFGFSAKPRSYSYSVKDQAQLIIHLSKHLQIESPHLLVHDYGVSVAQELLALQQESKTSMEFKSCCFLNGGLFPHTHRARPIQKLMASPIGPILSPLISKRTLKRTFKGIFGQETPPSTQQLNDSWELMTYNKGKLALVKLLDYMRERRREEARWLQAIKDPQQPHFLINGGADPVSGRHMLEYYKTQVKNPRYYLMPEIGHYPNLEAPSEVLQAYLEFVKPYIA